MARRVVAILVAVAALAGCAESNSEVNVGPDRKADPQMVRAAERVLVTAPTSQPGWHVGVVVTEDQKTVQGLFGPWKQWTAGVLTSDGMTFLAGYCCDDPDANAAFPVMVDPGDLITWTVRDGDDGEVRLPGLRVLRKAAAQSAPDPSPSPSSTS